MHLSALLCAILSTTAIPTGAPIMPEQHPTTIRGAFDVRLSPQAADGTADIGRMLLDKRYHGALDAVGSGQMLGWRSPVQGSAGYVAMERVRGTLEGRQGSFTLQHSGLMDRGAPELHIRVVPDSADGGLLGLRGTMQIEIAADGAHSYVFRYALPAAVD